MKTSITTKWIDNMAFEAVVNGHKIILDADEKVGGQNRGPRPKPLLLIALAGCTGMDVVSILKKMRVEIKSFDINVEGDITEEHPKHYTKMHIIYSFSGTNLPLDKIEQAVKLSEEKYCGVRASYKGIEISSEIKLIEL
jgi:putative redox protein